MKVVRWRGGRREKLEGGKRNDEVKGRKVVR